MKIEVKRVFYDNNGLHRVGEIIEVRHFDDNLMKAIKEPEKASEKVVKKPSKGK